MELKTLWEKVSGKTQTMMESPGGKDQRRLGAVVGAAGDYKSGGQLLVRPKTILYLCGHRSKVVYLSFDRAKNN